MLSLAEGHHGCPQTSRRRGRGGSPTHGLRRDSPADVGVSDPGLQDCERVNRPWSRQCQPGKRVRAHGRVTGKVDDRAREQPHVTTKLFPRQRASPLVGATVPRAWVTCLREGRGSGHTDQHPRAEA